eukprot:TRINITY_DN13581_c0_g1_i1.p1 TRINITY_DN13581_c0_g1~~TRINITY_DN13581_c0_g1_i1.p1  ORF type:complete len:291 (-),score=52.97 TRINITY_DN13581_c0_g1_i1:82-954(-)
MASAAPSPSRARRKLRAAPGIVAAVCAVSVLSLVCSVVLEQPTSAWLSPSYLRRASSEVQQRRRLLIARAGTVKPRRKKAPAPVVRGFGAAQVVDVIPEDYDTKPQTFPVKKYPNGLLRAKNAEVTEFGPNLKQLAENLLETMYKADDGIGLAAPQVGINKRLMVFNPLRTPEKQNRQGDTVYVNPRITAFSDNSVEMYEACLSLPKIDAPVWRPDWIEVEAVDLKGEPYKQRLEGVDARIFQHEYDHLDGILFTDRVKDEDKDSIFGFEEAMTALRKAYALEGGKNSKP